VNALGSSLCCHRERLGNHALVLVEDNEDVLGRIQPKATHRGFRGGSQGGILPRQRRSWSRHAASVTG